MNSEPGAPATGSRRHLQEAQRLPTSCARSVTVGTDPDGILLAVAQFAVDIPGQAPGMHAGNSDIDALLFRWSGGRFVASGHFPLPGGENVEFFRIGERRFMAGASIRSGSGPYEMNVSSAIHEWIDDRCVVLQTFPTFGAKQWRHFSIGARHFLALAQGVDLPGLAPLHPRTSCLFEWDGGAFRELQAFPGRWGYGWCAFELDGRHFLAYADHLDRSVIYRWEQSRFEEFQVFPGGGGRAFTFFQSAGHSWLAFANLQRGTTVYRWEGTGFVAHQQLAGPGARALSVVAGAHGLYLINVNFIQGTAANPQRVPDSQVYCWDGQRFELGETFATSAATDVTTFEADGTRYIIVANSLAADMRFRTDTIVYRFLG
ncbi:MAG: hypothetical protein JWN85_4376 [Gammaproteobacteria bacterium]|nr:hypothetical protein [Gammaproteobacteria bacterium]